MSHLLRRKLLVTHNYPASVESLLGISKHTHLAVNSLLRTEAKFPIAKQPDAAPWSGVCLREHNLLALK